VIRDKEIVLISSVQLTLAFVVEFDLVLHLLQLLPFIVVYLLEQQLLQFHPGIHSNSIMEDVLIGAHSNKTRSFGHEEAAVLVIKARREALDLV